MNASIPTAYPMVRAAQKLGLNAAKRGLAYLPKPLRHACYRRLIRLRTSVPESLTFKIAETRDELDAAFRILHDAYVDMGYMEADPSGMRITPYHALPTTHTLIALRDNEVVGTVSLVEDGALGLPADKIFDLAALRKKRGRLAEISALAIKKTFRGNRGEVLFPLLRFLHTYCHRHQCCDQIVVATHPSWADYYEGIFLFQPLGHAAIASYSFVNGAPAQGLYLDIKLAHSRWFACYAHRPAHQNLFRYFVAAPERSIGATERTFSWSPGRGMTPELLEHFFGRRSDVFRSLSKENI